MDDFPEHIKKIMKNREEIGNILQIHGTIAGPNAGKKHNVEVLNKSAIVLLVACWEAYVEDLAEVSFEFMLQKAKQPSDVPKKVLALAAKELLDNDKDQAAIYELAGEGWKGVLNRHKECVKERYIGKLNTPRPSQIDDIFEKLIGIKNISKNWRWKGSSNAQVLARLDRLITLRGEIAHRVATSKPVRKAEVTRNLQFIGYLSVKLSNQTGRFLYELTNESPWIPMKYRSVH